MSVATLTLSLPVPPSVNHYWRSTPRGVLISRVGRIYRTRCVGRIGALRQAPLLGRLSISITYHPPDNRRRDLDNVLKALLDAMQHANVYRDDNQIDRLLIERGDTYAQGGVIVEINEMEGA